MFAALGDHGGHRIGRYRDHGHVDRALDLPDRAVRGHPVDLVAAVREGVVDRVQRTPVPGVPDVAEDAAADTAGRAADADDGDGAGGEQPPYRVGLGALLPGPLHGHRAVGGFEAELQPDDAVLEAALLGVPGVGEHLDHLAVGGQHLGGEAPDAALAGDGRDVLQQRGGDPPALMGVLHQEGDLRLIGGSGGGHAIGADAVVAYGGDELAADGGGEPHPVHEVVVCEAVHVLGGEPGVRREEAVVLRLVGHLLVEADETVGVVGGDGPDARGPAVAQHHVRLPVGGVLLPVLPVRRGLHGPRVRLARAYGASRRVGHGSRAEAAVRRPVRSGPGEVKCRSGHGFPYGKLV